MTVQLFKNRTTTGTSSEFDGRGIAMIAPNLRLNGSSATVALEGKSNGAWSTIKTFTLPGEIGGQWLAKKYDAYRFNVLSITGNLNAYLSSVGGFKSGGGGAVDSYARELATRALSVAEQALALAGNGGVVSEDPPGNWPEEQEAPYLRANGGPFVPVTRVNNLRPLSHQNDTRYVINPVVTDDFNTFDETKWEKVPSSPYVQGQSLGRIPARFWRNNVAVENGELTIRMHQVNPAQTDPEADDYDPARDMDQPTQYGGYTSGCCMSEALVLYGYYEIEAKIMPSAGSSAFWLAWGANGTPVTEIDVFEMGGKGTTADPAGDELPRLPSNNRYNMNYHLFESAASPGQNGYNEDRTWVAPFDFADDYHVYGLQWDPDFIRWYVDGVLIHVKPTRDQHTPMRVILDSEAFWGGQANGGWFGFPNNADLPSKFRIKYVRGWTKN